MQTNSLILISAIGAASEAVKAAEGLIFGSKGFRGRYAAETDCVFLSAYSELDWRHHKKLCGVHLRNLAVRTWRGPRWQ